MSDWTAYCAPGHRPIAAIVLILAGEDVTGIEETAALSGDWIVLVNEAAIGDALSLDLPLEMSPPAGILARPPYGWPLRMLSDDLARQSLREHMTLLVPGV